ncbi:hypothetical protein [Paenibacillus odorifer]|uniref:Uncharacterized protein n=1 Tax=Paenibacillus odorifer TaxID=189426 RepID=A0ABX3GQH5_9BACL|nr:hypothetical protein [Paenibacillus odorifer]OMD34809.1 hypothetical protein BSO21_10340 [Paenibacillus odorifer]
MLREKLNIENKSQTDCIKGNSQTLSDIRAWVDVISNKIPNNPVLKMIKMRPEVFENLKNAIPIERRSSMTDDQVLQYFGVPFQIVFNLKSNIEYIYH